jgi:hypothetical protein
MITVIMGIRMVLQGIPSILQGILFILFGYSHGNILVFNQITFRIPLGIPLVINVLKKHEKNTQIANKYSVLATDYRLLQGKKT